MSYVFLHAGAMVLRYPLIMPHELLHLRVCSQCRCALMRRDHKARLREIFEDWAYGIVMSGDFQSRFAWWSCIPNFYTSRGICFLIPRACARRGSWVLCITALVVEDHNTLSLKCFEYFAKKQAISKALEGLDIGAYMVTGSYLNDVQLLLGGWKVPTEEFRPSIE